MKPVGTMKSLQIPMELTDLNLCVELLNGVHRISKGFFQSFFELHVVLYYKPSAHTEFPVPITEETTEHVEVFFSASFAIIAAFLCLNVNPLVFFMSNCPGESP